MPRMTLALVLAAALAAGGAYAAVTLTRDSTPALAVGVAKIVSPSDAAGAAKLVGHEVYGVGEVYSPDAEQASSLARSVVPLRTSTALGGKSVFERWLST